MRQWLLLGLLLAGCTGGFNSSQGPAPDGGEDGQTKELKYFGYYASGMDGIGTINDIDELKDKSNLFFIHSGQMREMLAKCKEVGMKAIVSFSWLTFDAQNRLFPDWQERIKWATDIIDEYPETVVAIYIMDEPYMNGAKSGMSVDEIYNQLETLGQFFKARYPKIALPVIFSGSEMRTGMKLPPSFDWFGMDCYDSFYWCEKNSVQGHYNKIKSMISALEAADGRKRYLMAVPPAGYDARDSNAEANHVQQVEPFRKFIKSEPKMRIVMPFIWQTFQDGTGGGWVGARDSAKLKPLYIKMYQDFMADKL